MFLHPINATFIVSFADTFADALPSKGLTVIPAASAEEYLKKDLLLTIIIIKILRQRYGFFITINLYNFLSHKLQFFSK
jgi:hypothetical protein